MDSFVRVIRKPQGLEWAVTHEEKQYFASVREGECQLFASGMRAAFRIMLEELKPISEGINEAIKSW